jgi:CubicO group peptidase (beta-lactamase class C family)
MKKNLLFLLLLWLTPFLVSIAQTTPYSKEVLAKIQQIEQHLASYVIRTPDDKDWTLQERMSYHKIHGLSLAVVHNYQIEWAKAYGWADTSQHRPLTTQTRFQAGSISKSLNGVGVLSLVQDKKIDLYADINNYLTSWTFPYDSVAKGKKINTANLLSHTAGLTIHGFPGYGPNRAIPSLKEVLDGQKPANTQAVRSAFEPGLKYQYSGGGTTISQLLIMDVTHQAYDQYMWERVLKPMGMLNSSYTQPPVDETLLATGYWASGSQVPGKYNIYPEQAAAGLWTTPTDLCRYIIETQLAYEGKSSKVLSQQSTRLRLTPYVDSSAALGVLIVKKGSETYFSHSGSDMGFLSLYYGSLTGGNGVVVMVNSQNGAILDEIANSVATVYNWKGFYKPVLKQMMAVPASVLDSYVGEYQGPLGKNIVTRTDN